MEVTLKFDWPNHLHFFVNSQDPPDHYIEAEINFCRLCDAAAKQSGIPIDRHFEHPKGCKCYWCVSYKCSELRKRKES